MDVRDLSHYSMSLETTGVQPCRLPDAGAVGASENAPFTSGDSSRFSVTARSLAQVMQLPDVREDRIAALQGRIAAGIYEVPSQYVADAILRTVAG